MDWLNSLYINLRDISHQINEKPITESLPPNLAFLCDFVLRMKILDNAHAYLRIRTKFILCIFEVHNVTAEIQRGGFPDNPNTRHLVGLCILLDQMTSFMLYVLMPYIDARLYGFYKVKPSSF